MRLAAAIACLTCVPVILMAALWRLGAPFWSAGLVGMAAAVLSSALLLTVLRRNLRAVAADIRRVTYDDYPLPPPDAHLLDPLPDEIAGLSRRLASHTAVIEQQRRADTQILERLPDPVLLLAPDRAIRRANAAARDGFAADAASVLRHPEVRAAIDKAVASGTTGTADVTLPAPMQRDLLVTAVPINPPLADGGQILLVLSDRSRERLFERMRADFVANVSHELRTPLASLIGFTETLRGPAADDKPAQQRFLAIMAEQGARMNRLIDDLLSLSRIELTQHQPPAEWADLAQIVPRVAAGFEPRLASRSMALSLRIEPDLAHIQADGDQVTQVVQNLMDNALKYGREGGHMRVEVQPAVPGSRWPNRPGVTISVHDDGAGIARQHLPRLTERFYRVDKGRSRSVGGTGLGLAIVKHIVNRHRGQLAIDSEEGRGTTVHVWLPNVQTAARSGEAI